MMQGKREVTTRARFLASVGIWIARATSLLSASILLSFFIGEGFNPLAISAVEWIGFVFFPLGVIAGMAIAWRRECLGGTIAASSLVAFYIFNAVVTGRMPGGLAFAVFTAPALLFLLCGTLRRQKAVA